METKKPKASILAVSLIVTGVMIIIALGIASSSIQSRKASIGSSQSNVAFQNADSGVEIVMQKIKDNSTNPAAKVSAIDTDGTCDGIFNSADPKYKIELKKTGGTEAATCADLVSVIDIIKSTGYSSQDSRAIEVAVAQSGSGPGSWTCTLRSMNSVNTPGFWGITSATAVCQGDEKAISGGCLLQGGATILLASVPRAIGFGEGQGWTCHVDTGNVSAIANCCL